MDVSWVVPLLGRPWRPAACGPDAFYCWGLVRYVYRERFGRDLPDFEVSQWRLRGYADMFLEQQESSTNWQQVPHPRHGDVVLLGRNRVITHCGMWVGPEGMRGSVLHCIEPAQQGRMGASGVVAQPLIAVKCFGWGRIEYYRHKDFLECQPQ